MIAEPAAVRRLADKLKRRGICRLVYFHCDHFEPWSHFDNRSANDPRHVEDVIQFAQLCAAIPYARKLTLFYQPFQSFILDPVRELLRAYPGDAIGFIPRSPSEIESGRNAMRGLLKNVDHEIQLHMHHEGFTSNTSHRQPERIHYFATQDGRAGDGPRLSLALELYKQAIREETELPFVDWFFVHGLWALQGSDPTVCNISDELQRLSDAGCKGDFTFPAGRSRVNPKHSAPYFCYPIDESRGYDVDRGEPELAYGNGRASTRKFFVWASSIKHTRSSLDYYDSNMMTLLDGPSEWVEDIIDCAYAAEGTLYFKTHAHSMAPFYRSVGGKLLPPHCHPKVQDLFGLLFDVASMADSNVEFLSVSEVYSEFVSAQYNPPLGNALFDASVLLPGADPVLSTPIAAPLWLEQLEITLEQATSKPNTLDVKVLATTINNVAVTVMRERIAAMGTNDSGAYNYYATAAARGHLLSDVSTAIVSVIEGMDRFDEYHEVGAGLGILGALIAATGRRTATIESDGRRYAAAEAIYEALVVSLPGLPETLTPFLGRFPAVLDDRDVSRSLAIFANFIGTIDQDAVLRAMKRYGACLVDIDRFGSQISGDNDRAARLAIFRSAELEDKGCVLDMPGGQGRYHLFGRPAVSRDRDASSHL